MHKRVLILDGENYKARLVGNTVRLELGTAYTVALDIPPDVGVKIDGAKMTLFSNRDVDSVKSFADIIRSKRPPNSYTGKGIRYENEIQNEEIKPIYKKLKR